MLETNRLNDKTWAKLFIVWWVYKIQHVQLFIFDVKALDITPTAQLSFNEDVPHTQHIIIDLMCASLDFYF